MPEWLHTATGEFTAVIGGTFVICALLYLGGRWIALRFSDPKWLKKYVPLLAFLFISTRIAVAVGHFVVRSTGHAEAFGYVFGALALWLAACIGAWRRCLRKHPAGPPPSLPSNGPDLS